jgi:quercetin dioxygenase-like cupin family protein
MLYKRDPSNYKELLPGIFMKTLTYGENSHLCEFRLKQGAIIPVHHHPQEQTGYLVQGSLRFFGDEGETIVEAGWSWNFKGGVSHGAEALVDSVLIEVFSPLRQDYLAAQSSQVAGNEPQD